MSAFTRAALVGLFLLSASLPARAHSGPPFPIVTDASRGPYTISIWTDPDATDNGTPGGQFWVVIGASTKGQSIPTNTRAAVSIQPLDREAGLQSKTRRAQRTPAGSITARAEPVRGDVTNQFATLLMDHEGPYSVRVDVNGALGQAVIESTVDATYDLRPAPYMLAWYLGPFLLAGLLWTRLLLRRRQARSERR
jgi:hypothetical protein